MICIHPELYVFSANSFRNERGQLMVSPIEESLHILPKPVYEWSELDSSGLEL